MQTIFSLLLFYLCSTIIQEDISLLLLFFLCVCPLGITDLHNGMILSTLSISSHGFALGVPKRLLLRVSPKGFISIEMYSLFINP